MPWNHRQYGSAADPIHKSHLNKLVGEYGCPKAFWYEMNARAAKLESEPTARDTVSGKAAAGTAAHETIARALTNPALVEALLSGKHSITTDRVREVFDVEWQREVGRRSVQWYGKDDESVLTDYEHMIARLLNTLHLYVERVVLVEAGFVAPIDKYWTCGHVDLVYVPKSNVHSLAMADWKTGASKPGALVLSHGWEAGVYSTAMQRGVFVSRDAIRSEQVTADGKTTAMCAGHEVTHASKYIAEREVLERALIDVAHSLERSGLTNALDDELDAALLEELGTGNVHHLAQFPSEIYHVHLADYVPYSKAGSKEVKRPEDLRHYGMRSPGKHKYVAGETRGPAWLPVELHAYDVPRIETRLRAVVGMVRMGFFLDQVSEMCGRCTYSRDCLTSGYAPRGDEKAALERALRGVSDDDTAALSDEDE